MYCAFFKQGLCKKGAKCKFSHDPDVEKRSAKKSIYAGEEKEEEDNMDDWDEEKLAEVVNKKHGSERKNQTDIVSAILTQASIFLSPLVASSLLDSAAQCV